MHVDEVIQELVSHPVRSFIRRWNWKAAVLSPLLRAGIIFAATVGSGLAPATGAMILELAYRGGTAGFCGTIVESFRNVEPYWAGQMTTLLLVPLVSDSFEVLVHWLHHTPHFGRSMALSLAFTVLSTSFNYYAMRQGAFVVGPGHRSLFEDLKMFPRLAVSFLSVLLCTAPSYAQSTPALNEILARMKTHEDSQARRLVEYSVQRKFQAENPRFKLKSSLEVKTVFHRPNALESQVLSSDGSQLIRERVFDKILEAEKETQSAGERQQIRIAPENYVFELAGREDCSGRPCTRINIVPKQKDKYSIKGQILVDDEDGAIVRIQGSPVKRPSFWTQRTEITREYQRIQGVWLCVRMESNSDIFLGGRSTLHIDYSYTDVRTED